MRYLTKEWWIKGSFAFEDTYLQEAEAAAEKNEEFFAWAYNEAYEKHKKSVGKLIEINNGEFAKYLFESRYQERIKNNRQLPQAIREKIADERVFALGYTTKEVKEAIKQYAIQAQAEKELVKECAKMVTRKAEKKLSEKIGLANKLSFFILEEVKREGKDILLDCTSMVLKVENGEIEERELSGKGIALGVELHEEGEKFALYFLLRNIDSEYDEDLGYLTVTGTDIKIL